MVREIQDQMENASIDRLKQGREGIMNACLRLKLVTDDRVCFSIESEEGVGTMIQIRLPIKTNDEK